MWTPYQATSQTRAKLQLEEFRKKKKKKIGSSLVHAGVLTSGFSVYINYLYIIYVLMEMYPIFGLAQTLMPFLMEPALGGNRMWPV